MLPLFVLASPLCGAALAVIAARRKALRVVAMYLVALVLVIAALPALLGNVDRPLVGAHSIFTSPRVTQYYVRREYMHSEPAYQGGARAIESLSCTQIGLISNQDGWEYAVWVMFALDNWPAHVQDVQVTNASAALMNSTPPSSFEPCAVFDIRAYATTPVPPHITLRNGQIYVPVWTRNEVAVYTAQATRSASADNGSRPQGTSNQTGARHLL